MEPTDDRKSNSKPRARVIIKYEWCKKCGICVAFCPTKVFTNDDFGAPIISSPEKCGNCGLCVLRCPDFSIKLEPTDSGNPKEEGRKTSLENPSDKRNTGEA
jgi:2-oxoglutarate ferredoxin oxidoreductase subunit delta